MTIEDILNKLDGVKQTNHNSWQARCPCHDDRKASLSITLLDGGTILLKCHAGCTTEDIVERLGMTMKDLFPPNKHYKTKPKPRPKVTKIYPYYDADGNLLYVKERREDKSFSQYRQDSKGGRIYNRQGVPHVLYRLHEVSKSDYVIVAEGEKDASTLCKQGFVATTGENGAGKGKWLAEYTEQLKGKQVFILGDNDKVGRDYQTEIANKLHGKASSVKVLDLKKVWPDIPEHGDVTDLFQTKGDETALELLADLMQSTAEWTPIITPKESHQMPQGFNYRPEDFSDAGNAEVFNKAFEGVLLFTQSMGWLYWNGMKWERNEYMAMSWAKELTKGMLDDALSHYKQALSIKADATASDDETALTNAKREEKIAKAYLTHAKASRNAIRIKAMIELAKSSLVVKAEQFDANPFDLNTPSGIVNLLTGDIRPHDKEAYCNQITTCSPCNDAKGLEMWYDFLNTVACNSEDVKTFLKNVAGMALIGEVYHEGIILAHGSGRNGKSTFFNALASVFGSYSGGIDVKTLTTDRGNKGASLATLKGKRLVTTGELEEHQRLSASTVKQLASTDMLTIEEKFKSPETVKQTHTLVLFTNHLPRVGSTDAGTWRRLNVVPFNATIPSDTGVQNFSEVLIDKAGGIILSWAIQGAIEFIKRGFKLYTPEEVKEATDAYRQREDWLANFIEDCCILNPNARVGAKELYQVYKTWADERKEYVRRMNELNDAMETAGYEKITPKNKRTWLGLRTYYSDMHCGMPAV